jgi:general secretion pathway protein J
MKMTHRSFSGFTLIEILIALTILAIVGVLMAMGLRSAVSTQQRLAQKSEQLTKIQTAIMIIERDLSQIINRPIVDASSEIRQAIDLRKTNQEIFFEFTRAGVVNPYSLQNRSTLQRVMYHFDGSTLSRVFWKGLDRTKDTPRETQILLTSVKSFNISLIKKQDQNNNPQAANPQSADPQQQLPTAIELSLESETFGFVSRFIKLAGDIPL